MQNDMRLKPKEWQISMLDQKSTGKQGKARDDAGARKRRVDLKYSTVVVSYRFLSEIIILPECDD